MRAAQSPRCVGLVSRHLAMPSWLFFSSRTSRPTFFFYLLNSLHLPKGTNSDVSGLLDLFQAPLMLSSLVCLFLRDRRCMTARCMQIMRSAYNSCESIERSSIVVLRNLHVLYRCLLWDPLQMLVGNGCLLRALSAFLMPSPQPLVGLLCRCLSSEVHVRCRLLTGFAEIG
jgi:hypothetical protein